MSGLLIKLGSLYETLAAAEKRVADYILANGETIPFQSVYDVAKASGVSIASVSRFARKVGCSNFKEFKIQIAQEVSTRVSAIYQGITAKDRDEQIVQKVFGGNQRSLEDTLKILNTPELIRAAETICRCQELLFFGLAVKYAMGKPLLNATIQEEVFRCGGELKNARITLTGVLHVPQATTVLAWHAGGSASRGIHRLDVDGRHVGSIGDDRVKDIVYRLPLKAGAYPVKWVLTGGDFGNSVLQFVDDRTKQILSVTASDEAVSVAISPPLKRILDNSSAQPRSLPTALGKGEPAAPAPAKKELTIETGDFTIHGTGFQPAVLKDDARAYENRRLQRRPIPAQKTPFHRDSRSVGSLQGHNFTREW